MSKLNKKKILYIVGIVSGCMMIIFGIVCFSTDAGIYLSSCEYGGDFYTDIYRGVRRTLEALGVTNMALSFLLIGLGVSNICIFLEKLFNMNDVEEKASKEELRADNLEISMKKLVSLLEEIKLQQEYNGMSENSPVKESIKNESATYENEFERNDVQEKVSVSGFQLKENNTNL